MRVKDIAREYDGDKQELVLTITADADEVDAAADAFFAEVAQREIPGFRKGKAPREILEKQVGGHQNAMGGVTERLINDKAFAAIDQSDVIFIDEPQFNVDEAAELGQPFTFTVSGPVVPEMELTDYAPIEIELPPAEATDAEVERYIQELRDHYHTFKTIDDPEYKAQLGDYVMADVTITNDSKVVSGLNNTGRLFGLGNGTMPMSFDECVVGSKVGDDLEFDFEAKLEDGTSPYGDGNLHGRVKVNEIRQQLVPDLDDEFAAKVGCVDVDDIYVQVRRNINEEKAKEMPRLKTDRVIDKLVERLDGEVPVYYVDFVRQDVGREFMQSLEAQGTNLQQWMLQNSVDGDKMKEDILIESARRAAIDCALDAVYRHDGLEITDADVDAMFDSSEEGQAARAQWEQANRMADVRKMTRQKKTTEHLGDTAIVTIVED